MTRTLQSSGFAGELDGALGTGRDGLKILFLVPFCRYMSIMAFVSLLSSYRLSTELARPVPRR
jgi:hypothetical protein